ncbi:DNA-directed RNA polymerases II 24 kDa polypeptide (RNA polymerase II subunit 5) [Rhizophlyctis rosea]|nr:DNA-directed RNA polymerases II 24 kDa polypeptide (RNA polymerase II subunit 5) [Rhizophlyctis rosea]
MVSDRGYTVLDEELDMTLEDFKASKCPNGSVSRSNLRFLVEKELHQGPKEKETLFVTFLVDESVGIKPIKTVIGEMQDVGADRCIIVYPKTLTSQANKIIQEGSSRYAIELFAEAELLVNITHHVLVPKHEVMTEVEKKTLLERYRLKQTQLPRIRQDDPVAKYYGMKRGQVVRIIRKSETAGHQIKRDKGANDLKRADKTSKITRQIQSAVRAMNGETDPSHNIYLAAALALAKANQVPKANIETALKKGAGLLSSQSEEPAQEVIYEALAPGGVALMIEALTNNRNRTFPEVRTVMNKRGGSLTPVQYLFQKRGRIVAGFGPCGHNNLEQLEEDAVVESGFVEDIGVANTDAGTLELFCAVGDVLPLRKDLESRGYDVKELEIAWVAKEKVDLSEEGQEKLEDVLNALEDLEDVVKIHHNANR